MGKALAMAAAACSMELGDAPTARDAVHHSRADEVGSIAAEGGCETKYSVVLRFGKIAEMPGRSVH
jgi:hypothetical protein